MKDIKIEDKYGWYMRHRKKEKKMDNNNDNENKEQNIKKETKNELNYEDIELDSIF